MYLNFKDSERLNFYYIQKASEISGCLPRSHGYSLENTYRASI